MARNGTFETIDTRLSDIISKLDKMDGKLDKTVKTANGLGKAFTDANEGADKIAKTTDKMSNSIEKAVKNMSFDSLTRNVRKLYNTFERLSKTSVDYIED